MDIFDAITEDPFILPLIGISTSLGLGASSLPPWGVQTGSTLAGFVLLSCGVVAVAYLIVGATREIAGSGQ